MELALKPSIILIIVSALVVVLILISAPFMRKLASKYWWWLIIALPIWIYVFGGRHVFYLLPDAAQSAGPANILTSRQLLLDLCPFYALVAPPLYFLKNKMAVKVMAPFGLFGALVTLGGGAIMNADQYQNEFVKYVFLGVGGNQMYFMMHFLAMVLSLMTLCWMRGWRVHYWLYMHGFAIFYYGYILIILAFMPSVQQNASGLLRIDWVSGEYLGVSAFLGVGQWPDVMIYGFVISYWTISLWFWLRYIFDVVGRRKAKKKTAQTAFLQNKHSAVKFLKPKLPVVKPIQKLITKPKTIKTT